MQQASERLPSSIIAHIARFGPPTFTEWTGWFVGWCNPASRTLQTNKSEMPVLTRWDGCHSTPFGGTFGQLERFHYLMPFGWSIQNWFRWIQIRVRSICENFLAETLNSMAGTPTTSALLTVDWLNLESLSTVFCVFSSRVVKIQSNTTFPNKFSKFSLIEVHPNHKSANCWTSTRVRK